MRTGSIGYEYVWQTKNSVHFVFAGTIGFIFTNSFKAINYFKKLSAKNVDINKNQVKQMVAYNPDAQIRSDQNTDQCKTK